MKTVSRLDGTSGLNQTIPSDDNIMGSGDGFAQLALLCRQWEAQLLACSGKLIHHTVLT